MPRLIRGQTAPGISAKSERIAASVQGRLVLVRELLEGRRKDALLVATCTTLAKIAAIDRKDLGIFPISVNSLRRHIDEEEGGLAAFLRDLRKLRTINRNGGKSDRRTLERRTIQGLENENASLVDGIAVWSKKYLDLLRRFRNLAEAFPQVKREFLAHQAAYRSSHRGNLEIVK